MFMGICFKRTGIWVFLFSVLTLFTLYACSENSPSSEGGETKLVIPSSQLVWNLTCEEQVFEVEITAGANWVAAADASSSSWITVSPTQGNAGTQKFAVSLSMNTSEDLRTGIVTVSSGGISKEISITQKPFETILNIPSDQLTWNLTCEEQIIEIKINTSKDWIAEVDASSSSWISLSPAQGSAGIHTLAVSISANTGKNLRTGTLMVSSGNLSREIIITQNEKILQPEGGGPEDMPVEEWK